MHDSTTAVEARSGPSQLPSVMSSSDQMNSTGLAQSGAQFPSDLNVAVTSPSVSSERATWATGPSRTLPVSSWV